MVRLSQIMLVGQLEFMWMNRNQMKEWVQKSCSFLPGYKPKVSAMANGWFGFNSLNEEDSKRIDAIPLVKGRGFLVL